MLKEDTPRPFLKWVGGKRQLMPKLLELVERAGSFGRYHEMFLGGGALFFALMRADLLRSKVHLSDINLNLIETYQGLREDVDSVIRALNRHKSQHSEAYFYRVRMAIPKTQAGRTARLIYLNRTCFNGLYRENKKGEFNVPFGRYKNPNICDAENLRSVAAKLQEVDIEPRDFVQAAKLVRRGDLVYCDPPYDPISKTAGFTDYAKGGFGLESQQTLAETFAALAKRGAHVVLSNSMTPLIEELYDDFYVSTVFVKRSVNAHPDKRGEVAEVLVTNFPHEGAYRRRKTRAG